MKITHNPINKWQDELRLMDLKDLTEWVELVIEESNEKCINKFKIWLSNQVNEKKLKSEYYQVFLVILDNYGKTISKSEKSF